MAFATRASNALGRSFCATPRHFTRSFASSGRVWNQPPNSHHVAVVGAAGGIGQPLSLLCKLNPRVERLSVYDVAPVTAGVGVDLSHINTRAQVKGFSGGASALEAALEGANIVIVPAGVPRKPGMTRQDLFNTNAGIVRDIAQAFGKVCPDAHLLIISNPVNSTVPVAAATLENMDGVAFNPRHLYGVSTLDVVRANTFIAEYLGMDVSEVNIPVLGGHAGKTIIPLLSHAPRPIPEADAEALRHRIQFGGDEVVQAKAGGGSATLSMAHAGHHFADRLMSALDGEEGVVECAYVQNSLSTVPFFASPLLLGRGGIKEILPLPSVDAVESQMIHEATQELAKSIAAGENFANDIPEPRNEEEARAQAGLPPKEAEAESADPAGEAAEEGNEAARAERRAARAAKRAERVAAAKE